jgi:translation elongation factor EF-1beta
MELKVKTVIKVMPIDYDIETDGLYLEGNVKGKLEGKIEGKIEGIEEGMEIKEQQIMLNLWSSQEFSLDTMAKLAVITPERTRQIILNALQNQGLSETEANQAIAIHEEKFNSSKA